MNLVYEGNGGIMSLHFAGLLDAIQRDEIISAGEEVTPPSHARDMQLPRVVGSMALAFGDVLRSVAHHVSALEGQLAHMDMDRVHVECILDHCARGANLAYQLMLFSGQIQERQSPMDLNDIVRNIDPIISGIVKREVYTEVDMADEVLWVMGDAMLLRQVLANLISNANDAVPLGGTITVATRRVDRDRKLPDLGCERTTGSCALLSIVNSKPGIEDSIRHRIFEPFFTTKPPGKGIGLGLPIVQTIVRAHHGCLNVVSKRDIGTIVHVYLPLVAHRH
jgi:signal transduction histidine kinase